MPYLIFEPAQIGPDGAVVCLVKAKNKYLPKIQGDEINHYDPAGEKTLASAARLKSDYLEKIRGDITIFPTTRFGSPAMKSLSSS